jgi:hypothetical protein
MFRQLMLFPSSVEPDAVERIVADEIVPAYTDSEGFMSLCLSVGDLMGPAARDGGTGTIVEATFDSLDTSIAAIMAESFESTKTKVESLGAHIYLFETREHSE